MEHTNEQPWDLDEWDFEQDLLQLECDCGDCDECGFDLTPEEEYELDLKIESHEERRRARIAESLEY